MRSSRCRFVCRTAAATIAGCADGGNRMHSSWRLTFVAMAALWACGCACAHAAEERIALLIGNQGYSAEIGPLTNPLNDVALLEKTLPKLGFQVTTVRNTSLAALHQAVNQHVRRVRAAGPGAVGFFYYSGHGAQDASSGINYLIPTDVATADDSQLWDRSMRLTDITGKLRLEADNATHFVVFDACRNALKLHKPGTRALLRSKGFRPIAQEPGMLIAYATAEGALASDVGEGSGPYAKVLSEEIVRPGIEAVTMFRNVQRRIRSQIDQEPFLGFSALGDIYFAGQTPGTPVSVATPPPAPVRPPVASVIKGKADTVCADLKVLVEQSERDFIAVRGASNRTGDLWNTSAMLFGFKQCEIRKVNASVTFTCTGAANDTQAKVRQQIGALATAAEACLGSAWRKRPLLDDAVSVNNLATDVSIIYSALPTFNERNPSKQEFVTGIQVYKTASAAPASPESIKPAKKPEGYCGSLAQVVRSAQQQFDDIIGRKKPPKSWVPKLRLEGWEGCSISELKDDKKESRYFSCELGPLPSAEAAEAMSEEIAGDVKSCLGQDWTPQRRRSAASGLTVIEYVSSAVETTVEIRSRKNYDNTFEIKIDVNVGG
jgi:hypothetical protein